MTKANEMLEAFEALLSDLQTAWGDCGGRYQVGRGDLCLLEEVHEVLAAQSDDAPPAAQQPVDQNEFEIVRAASRWFEDAANTWMERAQKAEAALSVPPGDQASWQPIETAPKDGTAIDIWSESRGREVNTRWVEQPYTGGAPWGWSNYRLGRITDATHWMPLPAGPALASEVKKP